MRVERERRESAEVAFVDHQFQWRDADGGVFGRVQSAGVADVDALAELAVEFGDREVAVAVDESGFDVRWDLEPTELGLHRERRQSGRDVLAALLAAIDS